MRRLRVADVTLKQVRSANGASPDQRAALRSLKLGRIGNVSSFPDSPNLQGQIRAVEHLVEVGDDPMSRREGPEAQSRRWASTT